QRTDKHLTVIRKRRSINPLTSFSPCGKRRLCRRGIWLVTDIDVVDCSEGVADDPRFRVESAHDVPYRTRRRRSTDERLGGVTGETQVHDPDERGKQSDSSGGDAEQGWLSGLWASVSSYTTRRGRHAAGVDD